MKTVNNEQVLDVVYDLASSMGLRIGEFLDRLQEDYGDPVFDTAGLPAEVIAELEHAKTLRKESRAAKRAGEEETRRNKDIAAFREQFPDLSAEEIPEEVWAEVASGMDLLHAYAYYLMTKGKKGDRADAVNKDNLERSAPALGEGSTEPSFTREEVERMSQKDVKKNYKNILRSMSKWKM